MLCTNCGTDSAPSTPHCPHCGAAYSPPLRPVTPPPAHAHTLAPERSDDETERAPANFIVRHWRGDFSLPFSYWVIGVLGKAALIVGMSAVGSSERIRDLGPTGSGLVILGIFSLLIAVVPWQMVGIWRSSSKYRQDGGSALWAGLAKLMVVLGSLNTGAELVRDGFPIMAEGARLAVGIDNTQPHEIRVLREGTELELAGGMPFGTTDAVRKALDETPGVKVLHLNSPGGRIKEAYKLYALIKERKLITYTSADCSSACSLAFLAGQERYLGTKGRLGFHSTSVADIGGDVVAQMNHELRTTLRQHGVPDSFIDRALSTSHKDMWFPSQDELLKAKVVDSVVDSRYFGLSGIKQWRDAHKIEQDLRSHPLFAALAEHDPKNYERLRNRLIAGIQNGHAQIDIQRDIRAVFVGEMIPSYIKKAPDVPLLRYWKAQIAEMRELEAIGPQQCADFAFPEMAHNPQDLQRLLSKAIQQEDLLALAEVVKGVATQSQGVNNPQQAMADVQQAMLSVEHASPGALHVMQRPALYKHNPAAQCSAIIRLYSEILALPDPARAGDALRFMLSE